MGSNGASGTLPVFGKFHKVISIAQAPAMLPEQQSQLLKDISGT